MPTTSGHHRSRDLQVQVRLMTGWVHQVRLPPGSAIRRGRTPRLGDLGDALHSGEWVRLADQRGERASDLLDTGADVRRG